MPKSKIKKDDPIKREVPNNDNLTHQAEYQEPRLLSICMRNKDRLEACIKKGITVDSFISDKCRFIFGMMAEHYSTYNATMSRETFKDEVEKRFPNEMESSHWRGIFDEMWRDRVEDQDFPSLINDMEGRSLQIQAYSVLQTYFDPMLKTVKEQRPLVERFQRDVARIKIHNEMAWVTSSTLSEKMGTVWKEIMERKDDPKKFHGLKTGLACMDQIFNGLNRGKYMVIMAIEGGGKTTFMLNLAHNFCASGLNVGYVTVESDDDTTSKRMMTIRSKVNYNRISRGGSDDHGLNDYTISQLLKTKEVFEGDFGKRFHWIKAMQGTPKEMIIDELNKKAAYTKLDVVFVDYLDVIGTNVKYPERPDLELADVSSALQNYATNNNILMITAQQMKTAKVQELTGKSGNPKNKVTGDNFNVGVGDMSGSKKISGAADYIFALYIDPNTVGRIYVQTVKARNSRSKDKFALSYDQDSGRIEDILPSPDGFDNIADDIASNPVFKNLVFEQPVEVGVDDTQKLQTSMGYISEGSAGDRDGWDMIDRGVDFFKGD